MKNGDFPMRVPYQNLRIFQGMKHQTLGIPAEGAAIAKEIAYQRAEALGALGVERSLRVS